jgi:hypothetical protein
MSGLGELRTQFPDNSNVCLGPFAPLHARDGNPTFAAFCTDVCYEDFVAVGRKAALDEPKDGDAQEADFAKLKEGHRDCNVNGCVGDT